MTSKPVKFAIVEIISFSRIHGLNGPRLHIYIYMYTWGGHIFFLVAGGGLTQTMITKTQQTTPYQPPAIYLGLVTSKPVVVTPTSSVFSAVCTLLLKTNTRGLFCMFATFGEDAILPWHQQPDINQTYSIRPIMGSRQANKSNLLHQTLQNALTSCQSDEEKCSF